MERAIRDVIACECLLTPIMLPFLLNALWKRQCSKLSLRKKLNPNANQGMGVRHYALHAPKPVTISERNAILDVMRNHA